MAADISKCEGTNCPLKETCYRFRAIPNEYRQSYFMEPPFKDDKCDFYLKIDGSLKINEPIK